MMWSDDPVRDWDRHCEEEERYLAKRRICDRCKDPIVEDTCYEHDGKYICEDCWDDYADEHFKVPTPVYDDDF